MKQKHGITWRENYNKSKSENAKQPQCPKEKEEGMDLLKQRKKCYIYTRVSTSMQVDGYSLDAQKDKLRKYAECEDMSIVGEYSEMKSIKDCIAENNYSFGDKQIGVITPTYFWGLPMKNDFAAF